MRRPSLPLGIALVLLAACNNSTTPAVTVTGYTVTVKSAPPATAQVGTSIPISFTITATESDGTTQPASGQPVTLTVTAGGGTINGSLSTIVTSGTDGSISATWILGGTIGTQTLEGAASTAIADANVAATAGPASALAIASAPSVAATPDVVLPSQPTIQLKDAFGNAVAQSGVVVTASVGTGTSTIGGTLTATTNASGIATFTNLSLGTPGSVTLRFSAPLNGATATANSATIVISPRPATQLSITTQGSAAVVLGVPLAVQPVVQLLDVNGAAALQSGIVVTAAIASGTGVLGGTATATTNASGTATFTNLSLTPIGSYTLRYTATLNGQTASITSQTIVVSPLPATQLSIATQPSTTASPTVALAVQPSVRLLDASNGNVSQSGIVVTATIATGAGTLGGTATATTNASGVATFTNLSLSAPGSFTLRFTATLNGTSTSVTSGAVVVSAFPPTQLSITTQPSTTAPAGTALTVQPVIQLLNVNGGTAAQSGIVVTATLLTGTGTLGGTATATTNASGVAAFTNLSVSTPDIYTFSFSATLNGLPVTVNSIAMTQPAPAFVSISAGDVLSCGLTASGAAWCWGSILQANNSSAVVTTTPTLVGGAHTFTSLAVGAEQNGVNPGGPSTAHACGLTAGGAVWCWGLGIDGELGNGLVASSALPVLVTGGKVFTSLTSGANHSCGLTAAGAAWCWGSNVNGELGDGAVNEPLNSTPVPVTGAHVFTALSAGGGITCGVEAGAVLCWGDNTAGDLGTGSQGNAFNSPQPIASALVFTTVAAGYEGACALTNAGAAWCWGFNAAGVLGNSTAAQLSAAPVAVSGAKVFTSLTRGQTSACGLVSTGAAWCWGSYPGDGGSTAVSAPTAVTGGLFFGSISTAVGTIGQTCGVTLTGVSVCWGVQVTGVVGGGNGFTVVNVLQPTAVGIPAGATIRRSVVKIH